MRPHILVSLLLGLFILSGCGGDANVEFLKAQTVPALGYKSIGRLYDGYDHFDSVEWSSFEEDGRTVVRAYCVYDRSLTDLGGETRPVLVFDYIVDPDNDRYSLDSVSAALEENGRVVEEAEVPEDNIYGIMNDFYEGKSVGIFREMSDFMKEISE